jgi:hypothetical protein
VFGQNRMLMKLYTVCLAIWFLRIAHWYICWTIIIVRGWWRLQPEEGICVWPSFVSTHEQELCTILPLYNMGTTQIIYVVSFDKIFHAPLILHLYYDTDSHPRYLWPFILVLLQRTGISYPFKNKWAVDLKPHVKLYWPTEVPSRHVVSNNFPILIKNTLHDLEKKKILVCR